MRAILVGMRYLLSLWAVAGTLCAQDAREIWKAFLVQEEAESQLRKDYGFLEVQRNWQVDKRGRTEENNVSERRYDNLFVEGATYRKLIGRNGKELSAAEKAKVEAALARTAAQRRAERRRSKGFLPGTRTMRVGGLAELAEFGELRLEGEQICEGKPAWLMRIEPWAAEKIAAQDPSKKELSAYRQSFWIAKDDFRLLQRRIEVVGPGSELLPGTIVTMVYGRPQTGMPNFELRRELDFSAKVFGMMKSRGRQIHEYSSFKKYDVASTISFEEVP